MNTNETKTDESERLLDYRVSVASSSVRPTIRIVSTKDYLETYKQLERLLEGKNEKQIDATILQLIHLEEEGEDTDILPLNLHGERVQGFQINEAFSFYDIYKARRDGAKWVDILQNLVHLDNFSENDIYLRVLEVESGIEVKTVEDMIKALRGEIDYEDVDEETLKEWRQDTLNKAMETRLRMEVENIIDNGGTWKDLEAVNLKKHNLDGEKVTFIWSYEKDEVTPKTEEFSYDTKLIRYIINYFNLNDLQEGPLRAKHIVEILEAPRIVEFRIKAAYRKSTVPYVDDGGAIEYVAKEDANVRFINREDGLDVVADLFNRRKIRSELKEKVNERFRD